MGLDTWNPWHGCRKCSEGCRNCYMYVMDALRERPEWSDHVFKTGKFGLPLKKDRQKRFKIKAGQRIRVNMTSDTFIEDAAPWLPEFWKIIRQRPDVYFWLLTKRPERILQSLPDDWGSGYDNVALSVTVENQERFDARWPVFEAVPARHKGLCCAPLLEGIDIVPALASGQLDEVLAGGENYENPRVCDMAWMESLSRQCERYYTNFCCYESGSNVRVGNTVRFWPKKADQAVIAHLMGFNRKFYDILPTLRDPSDGHVLARDELYQKTYNLNHCVFCANRMVCNGCLGCGDCCAPPVYGSVTEVWEEEDRLLRVDPPLAYEIYCRGQDKN